MIKIVLKSCETFKIVTSNHYFVVELVPLATNKDKGMNGSQNRVGKCRLSLVHTELGLQN